MTRHVFGGVWCASSATYALRKAAESNICSRGTRDIINNSFYVDDVWLHGPSFLRQFKDEWEQDRPEWTVSLCDPEVKRGVTHSVDLVCQDQDLTHPIDNIPIIYILHNHATERCFVPKHDVGSNDTIL